MRVDNISNNAIFKDFKEDIIMKKQVNLDLEAFDAVKLNKICRIDNNSNKNVNLEKIRKVINGKNINNNCKNSNTAYIHNYMYNDTSKSNINNIQNGVSRENITEEFEDIDYELENNYDYNRGNENNPALQSRINYENMGESGIKINYSPSDNKQSKYFNTNKINNNFKNLTYNNTNKIQYSPSENFNIISQPSIDNTTIIMGNYNTNYSFKNKWKFDLVSQKLTIFSKMTWLWLDYETGQK